MSKEKKELAIHDKDTGSSEVQVAQLTSKIENLSSLILDYYKNEKNFLKKTNKARKNLKRFSKKNCVNAYENILGKL